MSSTRLSSCESMVVSRICLKFVFFKMSCFEAHPTTHCGSHSATVLVNDVSRKSGNDSGLQLCANTHRFIHALRFLSPLTLKNVNTPTFFALSTIASAISLSVASITFSSKTTSPILVISLETTLFELSAHVISRFVDTFKQNFRFSSVAAAVARIPFVKGDASLMISFLPPFPSFPPNISQITNASAFAIGSSLLSAEIEAAPPPLSLNVFEPLPLDFIAIRSGKAAASKMDASNCFAPQKISSYTGSFAFNPSESISVETDFAILRISAAGASLARLRMFLANCCDDFRASETANGSTSKSKYEELLPVPAPPLLSLLYDFESASMIADFALVFLPFGAFFIFFERLLELGSFASTGTRITSIPRSPTFLPSFLRYSSSLLSSSLFIELLLLPISAMMTSRP